MKRKTTRRRQRQTGSLRERAPGKWELRYKGATTTVLHKTKTEAQEALRDFIEGLRNGGIMPNKRLTFNELADLYLAYKDRTKAGTTVAWYKRCLAQHVGPVIGNMLIESITGAHVEKLIADAKNRSRTKRKGEPLGATTSRNLVIAIRAVLGFAVKRGLLRKNVAQSVELPEADYCERTAMKVDDVKTLIAASLRTELEAVVPFAIGTGLRRAEICALRWSDLDLDSGTLQVRRAAALLDGKVIIKAPKTRRSQRTDHMPEFVLDILRNHKAEQARNLALLTTEFEARRRQRDGLVFIRRDGEPWNPNEMSRQFSRLIRRKKLPLFRFHDLRHGFASLAFAAGVPLKVVSESLGHAGIGITAQIYVHLLADQKREKAAALDAYLEKAIKPETESKSAS